MDQDEFDLIICGLCTTSGSEVESFVKQLDDLARTAEIRDLQWTPESGTHTLYRGIWRQLERSWTMRQASTLESPLLQVWQYIVTTPEYDHGIAADSTVFTQGFYSTLLNRLAYLAQQDLTKRKQERIALIHLKKLLHWVYSHRETDRPLLRHLLGKVILSTGDTGAARAGVVDGGNSKGHVAPLLDLVYSIIAGLGVAAGGEEGHCEQNMTSLLHDILLPLHAPNEMVLWRDQIPVIQTYHEPLVKCVLKLVEKDSQLRAAGGAAGALASKPTILVQAVLGILKMWPERFDTNTPKQVLLLHELEMLVEKASYEESLAFKTVVLGRLVRCIGTDADNIRPAQRALQWFKNPKIIAVLLPVPAHPELAEEALNFLLPALYRSGAMSWNPTVNKMTGLALKNLLARDEALFRRVCNDLLSTGVVKVPTSMKRSKLTHAELAGSGAGSPSVPDVQALGSAMASARSAKRSDSKGGNSDGEVLAKMADSVGAAEAGAGSKSNSPPTFPVPTGRPHRPPTTVRPADPSAGGLGSKPLPATSMAAMRGFDRSNPPPVTITGVAPWAMMKPAGGAVAGTSASSVSHPIGATSGGISTTAMPKRVLPPAFTPGGANRLSHAPPNALTHTIQEAKLARAQAEAGAREQLPAEGEGETEDVPDGYHRILAYIDQCVPGSAPRTAEEEAQAKLDDWLAVQAAATPTLLPSLRFHELVFGAVLGEGAFSTVKYARRITKDKTQSAWPEYAVKIIQASKIAELGYRTSVLREMAVLQLLSHPGVARMISAFRYSDSAYMVLEYAARGDLHTYILKHGKLAHKYCRFVLGEVAAGVHFIHEQGFSFGDLKPENILVTELGHIKITDFGGCRAVTEEASAMLKQSRSTLETMRNGDWKEESADSRESNTVLKVLGSAGEGCDVEEKEDDRLEGTPAYLPPEILRKQMRVPGFAADAWALGCVAFFCLHGRPRFFGDHDQVLDQIYEEGVRASGEGGEHKVHTVHFAEDKDEAPTDSCAEVAVRLQDRAGEAFCRALNSEDVASRLTVAQAVEHPYLTGGVLPADQDRLDSLRENTSAADSDFPFPMSPLSLHMQAPLDLPRGGIREGADLADQQWARRQFSVLWAPMPAEYGLEDDLSAQKGSGSGGAVSASDVWLMTHSYQLTPIAETATERGARFV